MLKLFTQKHVVLAMLLSPVLAVMAYFAVDQVVSEPPQPLAAGQAYPLNASSACRYESGACKLSNGDIEIWLRRQTPVSAGGSAEQVMLSISSNQPLTGLMLSEDERAPQQLSTQPSIDAGGSANSWQWLVSTKAQRLRLVAVIQQSQFFVEVPLVFVKENS